MLEIYEMFSIKEEKRGNIPTEYENCLEYIAKLPKVYENYNFRSFLKNVLKLMKIYENFSNF